MLAMTVAVAMTPYIAPEFSLATTQLKRCVAPSAERRLGLSARIDDEEHRAEGLGLANTTVRSAGRSWRENELSSAKVVDRATIESDFSCAKLASTRCIWWTRIAFTVDVVYYRGWERCQGR